MSPASSSRSACDALATTITRRRLHPCLSRFPTTPAPGRGQLVWRTASSRPPPSPPRRRTPIRRRADDPGAAATPGPAVRPRRGVPRHDGGADHQLSPTNLVGLLDDDPPARHRYPGRGSTVRSVAVGRSPAGTGTGPGTVTGGS